MRWIFLRLSYGILVLSASGGASAATLNVVAGQLVGASAVDVGGNLYDVEFVDGTCIDVFDGCDQSDFAFTTSTGALLGSQCIPSAEVGQLGDLS